MNQELTTERAKQLFNYCPMTGKLFNKVSRSTAMIGQEAGSKNDRGYCNVSVDGKNYLVHRVIWLMVYGTWPDDQIDHVNGIRDDNRLCNLRAVGQIENMRNRKTPKSNSSGTMGVHWNKRESCWRARIKVNGNLIELGHFKEKAEAIAARKAAELELGFHPNHGRVSDE